MRTPLPEPDKASFDRLAQAQQAYKETQKQQSVVQTLDQLRVQRDAEVSAGLPTRYNQQTIVGNVSGAGNRHVIEDSSPTRRHFNFPNQESDFGAGGIEVACEAVSDFPEGETSITGVTKITFDSALFKIHDNGGGEAQISLITDDCS